MINETLMILSRKHVENLALTKEDMAQAVNRLSLLLSRSSVSRIEIKYTETHYHRGRGVTGRTRSYKLAYQMKAIMDSKCSLRGPVV